jgi:condensin complex subunit 1
MEFSVPVTGDDLLTPSRSSYVVHNLLDRQKLPTQLSATSVAFREDGPLAVLDHFDALFSAIRHFSELERSTREDTWETLVDGTNSLYNVLNGLLDSQLSLSTRQQHCNATKMLSYLVTQFMVCSLREESKCSQILTGKKSAGQGRKSQRSTTDSNTSGICVRGLYSILHLLELEIHRLWEPPVPEESFVNCVTSCCYKLLESPTATKDKETRQLIFQVLGIAIQKYKHGIGAVVKVIQLVQNFEHLVMPMAEAMQFFATSCGVQNVVSETIREIGSLDASDLSRDTSGTRSLSLFVCELAERVPILVFPTISSLVPHLDGEVNTKIF